MKFTAHGLAAPLGLAAAVPVLRAEIAFCERDGFRGRSFTADQSVQNFARIGLDSRISSGRRVQSAYPYSQSRAWPR